MYEITIVEILGLMSGTFLAIEILKAWYNIKTITKNWASYISLKARVKKLEEAYQEVDYGTQGLDLSGLDLDKILSQLGLDAGVLKNPVVRGLISKVMSKKELLPSSDKDKESKIKFEG